MQQLLQQALALHQSGNPAEAIPLYHKVLESDPTSANALNLLAIAHLQQADAPQALPYIQKAIAINPNVADYYNTLGRVLLEGGNQADAIQAWRKAIDLNPILLEPLLNLGNSLCETAQYEEAVQFNKRALELDPRSVAALNNLGNALRAQGKIDDAIVAYRRAILAAGNLATIEEKQLKPAQRGDDRDAAKARLAEVGMARVPTGRAAEFATVCFNLGECHYTISNFEDAATCYRTALQADPKMLLAHVRLAATLAHLQRFDAAMQSWRDAAALAPDSALTHEALGLIQYYRQDSRQAEESFRRAVKSDPRSPTAWGSLARALESMGKLEEADQCNKKQHEIQGRNASLTHAATGPEENATDEGELIRLTEMSRRLNLTLEERIKIESGLGRVLDELGRYDEAFAHMAEANALVKRQRELAGEWYDNQRFRESVDRIISTFTPEYFAQRRDWGDPSELPVFILGMPRSGTTLVHQIAASHSQVHGVGELNLLQQIETEFGGDSEKLSTAQWDAAKVREVAQIYLNRLTALGPTAGRIVDKMPNNVIRVGQIATLFPRARVIFCRRDARDTCLSCFFQRFAQGLYFSLDLRDCGLRHVETDRLAAYWLSIRPVAMMEMQYETLVNDLEGQSRRLIEFLGLPWEPACLEFYRAQTAVLTASIRQVRKPIYQKSVGRSKHYEKHLGPLFDALGGDYARK
jgi:tetratricopeptide (TPR) repeat protein